MARRAGGGRRGARCGVGPRASEQAAKEQLAKTTTYLRLPPEGGAAMTAETTAGGRRDAPVINANGVRRCCPTADGFRVDRGGRAVPFSS